MTSPAPFNQPRPAGHLSPAACFPGRKKLVPLLFLFLGPPLKLAAVSDTLSFAERAKWAERREKFTVKCSYYSWPSILL